MVQRTLLVAFALIVGGSLAWAETRLERKIVIPAGTQIHCRLDQTITTRLNHPGDTFTATISEPLLVDGVPVIPAGSSVLGRIGRLKRPGRVKGVGEMQLTAEKVTLASGQAVALSGTLLGTTGADGARIGVEGELKGPSSRNRDIEKVAIAAGGAGFVGVLLGGVPGAVIGSVIGGSAGAADNLWRRGRDLTLPMGTQLSYQLTRAAEARYLE